MSYITQQEQWVNSLNDGGLEVHHLVEVLENRAARLAGLKTQMRIQLQKPQDGMDERNLTTIEGAMTALTTLAGG